MFDNRMTLNSFPRKLQLIRTYFFLTCLVESLPIGPERKHKIDFFALFYMIRLSSINYPIGLIHTQAIGKANNNTILSISKIAATEVVVKDVVNVA